MKRSDSPIISAEELSNQLSGNLPVYISPEDVNKYPQVTHLLEDLTHRLMPTGMSKNTYTLLTQATHSMKQARQKCLEVSTLHRLIQDVLYESPSEKDEEQYMKEMQEALTLSELQDHILLVDPESSYNEQEPQHTFGITQDLVLARAATTVSKKHIRELANALELQLEHEWVRIAVFHDPVGFLSYNPDEVAKIPEELENTHRKMVSDRNKLVHSITQTDFLFQQVHGLLLEYGSVLKGLMSKQRLSHYPAQHVESLNIILGAQLLKLKCIELEILVDTYTSQSVPALKTIHSHVKERTADAERSLAKLRHELSGYSGLDPKFQALLKEYAKLQQDIQFCKMSE
ncbi:uncharacterized protein LOC122261698 [Penaeus japonicus]|uniref:uncharacterized protein LOC122261698 n=1 Tax=Penaeus japonicus TaxID=27405 RepID=UPI001C711A48|nr:uncharacterized protein LOC122261698 [Penaeus japonicus]